MDAQIRIDLFHGLFHWHQFPDGRARLTRPDAPPRTIPDPATGRDLAIAHVDLGHAAICPACGQRTDGGFVSFVADLRLAYACPSCRQLVWIDGL
jgi:hypothetical protein